VLVGAPGETATTIAVPAERQQTVLEGLLPPLAVALNTACAGRVGAAAAAAAAATATGCSMEAHRLCVWVPLLVECVRALRSAACSPAQQVCVCITAFSLLQPPGFGVRALSYAPCSPLRVVLHSS